MKPAPFSPMKTLPNLNQFNQHDVLVIFGEVFSKGYVNGLIEAAQKKGMKIIYSTVGRRDADDTLRTLTPEEIAAAGNSPLINVPLEAGFDMTKSEQGITPVDQLKGVKISDWPLAKLDWKQIEESYQKGRKDFQARVKQYIDQLEPMLPADANVVFAHTMAGGVPRAKIYMPAMNRVFKGRGDRFESSQKFTESDLGKLALKNFDFVTADTFNDLLQATEKIRQRQSAKGKTVQYVAYGYHGTEILFGGKYQWQTYTCYFQGWAKMRLEQFAIDAWQKGVKACVFNCPEILTNSSSVFQGVEVSLYPFLAALKKEAGSNRKVQEVLQLCSSLLKDGCSLDTILQRAETYLTTPLAQEFFDYPHWPLHNRADQMELMLSASDELIEMHKDEKNLMTFPLSEQIFRGCGHLMLDEAAQIREPVSWLGHDIIAKKLNQL